MTSYVAVSKKTLDIDDRFIAHSNKDIEERENGTTIFVKVESPLDYRSVKAYRDEEGNIQLRQDDEIQAWLDKEPERIIASKFKRLRHERNRKLLECDWTQLPNAALSGALKYEWETYRQTLRDLPRNTEDPDNIVWPTPPQ